MMPQPSTHHAVKRESRAVPSPSSPALRVITDPEVVESLASDRQAWSALWEAVIRESEAAQEDDTDEPRETPLDDEAPYREAPADRSQEAALRRRVPLLNAS